MPTASQIHPLTIGASRIYAAPAGTTLPTSADVPALLAGELTEFVYMGDTVGGVTLQEDRDIAWAGSDQAGRDLDGATTSIETTVSTQLRGMTAANLADLLHTEPGTEVNGDTLIRAGGKGRSRKMVLVVVGPYGDGGTSVFVAGRVQHASGLEQATSAEEWTQLPATLRVLSAGTGDPADDFDLWLVGGDTGDTPDAPFVATLEIEMVDVGATTDIYTGPLPAGEVVQLTANVDTDRPGAADEWLTALIQEDVGDGTFQDVGSPIAVSAEGSDFHEVWFVNGGSYELTGDGQTRTFVVLAWTTQGPSPVMAPNLADDIMFSAPVDITWESA